MIALGQFEEFSITTRPVDALLFDDEQLLVLDAEGKVIKVSLMDGGQEDFLTSPTGGNQFSLSTKKGVLACSGPEGYALFDVQTRRLIGQRSGAWSAAVRWHETGERLIVTFGRRIEVLSFDGNQIFESDEMASTVTDASWIGDEFAIAAYGGVSVSKNEGRKISKREFVGSLLCLATSPLGDWIVSGNQDSSLQVYKTSDDTRLEMQGFPRKISIVRFNIDGKWLANNGADEVTVWSFASKGPKGRSPVILPNHLNGGTAISWHPALPNLLATGDGSGLLRIWDLNLGLEGKPLASHSNIQLGSTSTIKSIIWNLDGSFIVVLQEDGTVTRRGFK